MNSILTPSASTSQSNRVMPYTLSARYYDLIYSNKDYEKECDFVEEMLHKFGRTQATKRIVDLGCGTGGHAIVLGRRGHEVFGVDRSREMVGIAKKKPRGSAHVEFAQQDIRRLKLPKRFDAAISMFAVMSYLSTREDLKLALRSIRSHLLKGSIFIFDFWYAPAVISQLPSDRTLSVGYGGYFLIRNSHSELDTSNKTCTVRHDFFLYRNRKLVKRLSELHVLRYFYSNELRRLLSETGFSVIRYCADWNENRRPTDKDWFAIAVARAS